MAEETIYPCGLREIGAPADPAAIPPKSFGHEIAMKIRKFHASVPGYAVTPLYSMEHLADKMGVGAIYMKDESARFGLNAFKGLGGVYAIGQLLCRELGLDSGSLFRQICQAVETSGKHFTFCTATDGNHGRGVAWSAKHYGCESVVFVPRGTAEARIDAIRAAGAGRVVIADGDYDTAVAEAARTAQANGWFLVQDTAWEGYTEVPLWIAQGYSTIAAELFQQLEAIGCRAPSHVFLQAGVGTFAACILGQFANAYADALPVTSIVEATASAGIFESMLCGDGKPHTAGGSGITAMAGLNCATPNPKLFPVLRDFASYYFACPDVAAEYGMRMLARPLSGDPVIVSGASGAATAGLLAWIAKKDELQRLRQRMGLDVDAQILLINTEGSTDPAHYQRTMAVMGDQ